MHENGFEKYQKLMVDFAKEFLTPLYEKSQENNEMYIEQTSVEFLIFRGYTEISTSYETLLLIEKFITLYPPNLDGINYSNYLNYHIHNYLQEMYIIKERLNSYATIIQRRYSKATDKEFLKPIMNSLFEIVKHTLHGITGEGKTGVRNIHVHHERFTDEEMNWLSSTTFLSQFHEEFKIESQKAYESAKNKWHNLIQTNNAELLKLFEIYFDALFNIITLDGKIYLPKS